MGSKSSKARLGSYWNLHMIYKGEIVIKFHVDGTSKWDYAINEYHLQLKLAGRPATIVRPLCGVRYWVNAFKALVGLSYEVNEVERFSGQV